MLRSLQLVKKWLVYLNRKGSVAGRELKQQSQYNSKESLLTSWGFQITSVSPLRGERILEGLKIEIQEVVEDPNRCQVIINGQGLPSGLIIGREAFEIDSEDDDTGDVDFDNWASIRLDKEEHLSALLSVDVRDRLIPMLGAGFLIRGDIACGILQWRQISVPLLVKCVDVMKGLAHKESHIPDLLAVNIRSERLAETKVKFFYQLLKNFPSNENTLRSARFLREDPDTGLRLLADLYLGSKGEPHQWTATAENIGDEASVIRAMRIISAPGLPLTDETVRLKLKEIIMNGTNRLRLSGAENLARFRVTKDIDVIVEAFNSLKTSDDLIRAFHVLENFPSEKTENFLLEKMRESDENLFPFVVQAIGRIGTVKTVEPLLQEKNKRTSRLHQNLDWAIAQIQSRLGSRVKGSLTVMENDGKQGNLTLDSGGGEISLK